MCIFCELRTTNPLLDYYPKVGDELPPCDLTFFLPDLLTRNKTDKNLAEILIDEEAYKHIPHQVKQIIKVQETMFYPLRTEGDGNCLLRAISRAMWGTEDWHEILRKKMTEEIEQNEPFYKKYFSYTGFTNEELDEVDEDWKIVLKQAKGDGSYLQAIHIFALSHVIKRPIILYAPDNDIDNFGIGATGVAGTFVPIRIEPKSCSSKVPLAICWSSSFKNHFVPIVGFSGKPNPLWPIIQSAYNTIDNNKLGEYILIEKKTLDHNDHLVTQHLDKSMGETIPDIPIRNCQMEEEQDMMSMLVNLQRITAYGCQITFPKGMNLEKKMDEILNPYEFEAWKIPRLKKLLTNFSKRSDLDGMRVKSEPSFICPCGYKHMVDKKCYDLHTDLKDCSMGWNFGEHEITVADRFLEKYPFEPEFRLQIILHLKKKNEIVRCKLLPGEPHDEEKIKVQMRCPRCYDTMTFPKFDLQATCKSCKLTFPNPQGIVERECPFECGGSMKFVKEKMYVSCDTCKKMLVLFSCNKCNNVTGSPMEQVMTKEFISCLSCKKQLITPFHSVCKRPNPIFPYNDYLYSKGTNAEQLVGIVKKTSAKISEPYNLNESDFQRLDGLWKKINSEKNLFLKDDLDLFFDKLFHWTFPSIVVCLDLFKLVLNNPVSHKHLSHLSFAERADLFIDIAFRFNKEKDCWKIFNVASQCLLNNFAYPDKSSNPTYFKCLDNVLKFIDHSLETKNTSVFIYVAKILVNYSCLPTKLTNFETRNQISIFLVINVIPILLEMRDSFIKETLKVGAKPTTFEDQNQSKAITELAKNISNLNEALFALFLCLGNILFHESDLADSLKENNISSLIEQVFEQGALLDKSWDDPFRFKLENSILEIIIK